MAQWRSFVFFELDVVREAFTHLEITAATCGRGTIIVGDAEGWIRLFDRSSPGKPIKTFPAYMRSVSHFRHLKTRSVLVSIGDDGDDGINQGTVKVWDIDRCDAQGVPQHREIKLFTAKYPAPTQTIPLRQCFNPDVNIRLRGNPKGDKKEDRVGDVFQADVTSCVVSFDVTEDLQHLIAALASGEMVWVKGDLEKDRAPKVRRIQSSFSKGDKLTFVGLPRSTLPNAQLMYAVYEHCVAVWRLTAKGDTLEDLIAHDEGAEFGCSGISEDGELVVANDNMITFYGGDKFVEDISRKWNPDTLIGHKRCEVEGQKFFIGFFRSYLIVVSRQSQDTRFQLNILDTEAKIKALTGQQSTFHNIVSILTDWGEVLVITQDTKSDYVNQKVTRLCERETHAKLDQLFKRDHYAEALQMARRQNYDQAFIVDITRRYGDHLYDKGTYTQAIEQYMKVIGSLEPSYVIRKYLDAQRIGNLTTYLEELHDERHNVANQNHTTLLLNCYTKLKLTKKLNEFIRRDRIRFDVNNAIKVCRQAKEFEAATYLAKSHDTQEYLKILIEDLDHSTEALQHIQSLDLATASKALQFHGKRLMSQMPQETTPILIQICTAWSSGDKHKRAHHGDGAQNRVPAEEFMHAFVDSPRYLLEFLKAVVTESNLAQSASHDEDPKIIYNTLLELYLTKDLKDTIRDTNASRPTVNDYVTRRKEALNFLRDYSGKYCDDHALILVQQHDFEDGILFMLEHKKMYQELLAYHSKKFEESKNNRDMRDHVKNALMETCEKYGDSGEAGREMWVNLLVLLVRDGHDVNREIIAVLEKIEENDLLPPLAVIEILQGNPEIQLGTVRDYILRQLSRDMQEVTKNQKEAKDLQAKVTKNRQDIRELQTTAQIFQSTKCTACQQLLELPAVHFLCKHSYHQKCLNEARECNECSKANQAVLQMKRDFDEKMEDHNTFFTRVATAGDGFGVVAEYFGRGIFNGQYVKPTDDDALALGVDGQTEEQLW